MTRAVLVGCCLLVAVGCGGGEGGETVRQTIGSAGGTITVGGATLTIPAGALATDTEISVTESDGSIPGGAAAFSPAYLFSPAGLTFDTPAVVEIDYSGDGAEAVVLWSADGTAWEGLTTSSDVSTAAGLIEHFSIGFVADRTVSFPGFDGEGSDGDDQCGPAFHGDLWTCMQERCTALFQGCFGVGALQGSFSGACATYGSCICDCPDEAGNGCSCLLDTTCEDCETGSGLFDCISAECSDFF